MNFPCQGHFWLPGSPDKSVFGTLTFTRREGANLSLADALSADTSEVEHAIILGQTAGGAYVTLMHAIRTQAPFLRLAASYPCSYHATLLISGAAFESESDMRFSHWQMRIPEMRAWVGRTGFEIDSAELFAGLDCPAVRIEYRTPEKQVLLCDGDGTRYLARVLAAAPYPPGPRLSPPGRQPRSSAVSLRHAPRLYADGHQIRAFPDARDWQSGPCGIDQGGRSRRRSGKHCPSGHC